MSTATQESHVRVSELDGLRGLAVVMVLTWHFVGSMSDQKTWLSSAAHAATIFGRTGVDLFFVLSGFLIIGILVDHRDSPNVAKVFYWRRFLRIYPPYVILIVLYWLCYAVTGESAGFNTDGGVALQLFAQSTFTWNWLMAVANGAVAKGFSVTWSVAIEEWFYLVFPWLIFAIPRRRLPMVLAAVAVLSVTLRALCYLAFPQFPLAPYVLTPFRLDALCAGGLLALSLRSDVVAVWLKRKAKHIAAASFLFASSLPVVVASIREDLDWHMFLWGHSYLSVGFSLVLLWLLQNIGQPWTGLFRAKILVHAGWYSYSLYLLHPLLISFFFQISGMREEVTSFESGFVAASALLAAITISVGLFWILERPLQRMGRRSVYRQVGIDSLGSRDAGPSRSQLPV